MELQENDSCLDDSMDGKTHWIYRPSLKAYCPDSILMSGRYFIFIVRAWTKCARQKNILLSGQYLVAGEKRGYMTNCKLSRQHISSGTMNFTVIWSGYFPARLTLKCRYQPFCIKINPTMSVFSWVPWPVFCSRCTCFRVQGNKEWSNEHSVDLWTGHWSKPCAPQNLLHLTGIMNKTVMNGS